MLRNRVKYTFADLLTQSPEDEHICDILDGDLVIHASVTDPHAAVVSELLYLLLQADRADYGWARSCPRAVAFDYPERGTEAVDVTHPDILFVTKARRAIMGYQCIEGAPDLVIEVLSPSTRLDDRPGGRKFEIYERYGVPYYWTVDTDERTITQYVLRDSHFDGGTVLREGDILSCPLFPSITRPVAEIFAAIL